MTLPARSGRPFRAAAVASVLVAGMVCVQCSKIPTNPSAVFSLAIDSIPSPSVVAGDTLRDTTGVVHPLTGRAYNIQNQVLTNVLVKFISLSPNQVTIDASNFAYGATGGDSIARVVADAHGLQSLPFTLPVVLRPDSILYADSDSITTVTPSIFSPDSNTSLGLDVLLKHNPDTINADSVTRSYLVRYQITYPANSAGGTGTPSDTTLPIYLVNASGIPSRTDTTDAIGLATRQVFFSVGRLTHGSPPDSVVIQATAFYRTTPIGRSPLRFVIHYTAP